MSSPCNRSSSKPPTASNGRRRTARLADSPAGRNPIWRKAAGWAGDAGKPFNDQKSNTPAITSAFSRPARQLANQPAPTRSSASQKATRSPCAARTPALRAAGAPGRPEASMTRNRSCAAAHARANSSLPSVDPLSTTTTSQGSGHSWAASACSCSSSHGRPSRTGTTTLIKSPSQVAPDLAGGCPPPLHPTLEPPGVSPAHGRRSQGRVPAVSPVPGTVILTP